MAFKRCVIMSCSSKCGPGLEAEFFLLLPLLCFIDKFCRRFLSRKDFIYPAVILALPDHLPSDVFWFLVVRLPYLFPQRLWSLGGVEAMRCLV
jgi:hypothetical protein